MIESSLSMRILGKMLDVASLRQEVIAHNIANINTPGFTGQQVLFEEKLTQALAQQTPNALRHLEPAIVPSTSMSARMDGNNVDLDLEMGALTKNFILFKSFLQFMNTQIAQYRSAIQGR